MSVVLRKSGLVRRRAGVSRLSAWCHPPTAENDTTTPPKNIEHKQPLSAHQPRIHCQGDGTREAAVDWHGWRLLRQRRGRIRQRRVQDRARLAGQTILEPKRLGTVDVPMDLVVEFEMAAPVSGLQDNGTGRNRVLCKPNGTSCLTVRVE